MGSLPIFAAMEKWVIPVSADIQLALDVNPHAINFGTVFAQEEFHEELKVGMSEAFLGEDRVNDICYSIEVEGPPIYQIGQDLSPFLTLTKTDEIDDPFDCPIPEAAELNPEGLIKFDEETEDSNKMDIWDLKLKLPGVFNYDSTQHVICDEEDFLEDEWCNEPLGDLGYYAAKIQIEVSEISETLPR